MHRDLQRYLDGEIPREALSADLQQEAREWEVLLEDAHELRRDPAPPWLENRVMAALPAIPLQPTWRRALEWVLQPQAVTLRPATLLAGALAVAAGFALWPRTVPTPAQAPVAAVAMAPAPAAQEAAPAPVPPANAADAAVIYVQFTMSAPGARTVEVAGDFNGWQPQRAQLRDPEGDGNWSALVALPAGVHKYMFVIDGKRWVSDPHAHRFVDDGYGMKNSLIAVAPPTRSS